ncbi:MAG: hypothetical protein PUI29_11190 [Aeromonadales bacterium]|nr:hypothetical protein [Aeromonadales bacterium]MDY2891546.1 hypothetical protein [Succinivibrio sp.]
MSAWTRERVSFYIAMIATVAVFNLVGPSYAGLTTQEELWARLGRSIGALALPFIGYAIARFGFKKQRAAYLAFTIIAVLRMGMLLFAQAQG